MAALRAGARGDPFTGLLAEDVISIGDLARLGINLAEDVLEQGLLLREELAALPIKFPENAILTDGEERLLRSMIDEHALEHRIEIESFAWYMLKVPFQFPSVGIERQGRIGIQHR